MNKKTDTNPFTTAVGDMMSAGIKPELKNDVVETNTQIDKPTPKSRKNTNIEHSTEKETKTPNIEEEIDVKSGSQKIENQGIIAGIEELLNEQVGKGRGVSRTLYFSTRVTFWLKDQAKRTGKSESRVLDEIMCKVIDSIEGQQTPN